MVSYKHKQIVRRAIEAVVEEFDALEAKSPKGEASAIACSGAGCPDSEGIRGVPGPGEIPPEIVTMIKGELDRPERMAWSEERREAWKDCCNQILNILGV